VAAACGAASGEEAVARARAGDPAARAAFAVAAAALQETVAAVTAVVDVSEVRVGGGFGTSAFDLLFPRTSLDPDLRHYPPIHDDVTIRRATTGARAQVLGLAAAVFGA